MKRLPAGVPIVMLVRTKIVTVRYNTTHKGN